MSTQDNLAISFVHAYDDFYKPNEDELPALWLLKNGDSIVKKYPFPRNLNDFYDLKTKITGSMPLESAENFKKLPRFGLTGLKSNGEFLYAGSWNAVYEINKKNFELSRIISNNLMNDMHGIWVDENIIITILTGKDTIVISDHDGNVIEHFAIHKDLSVHCDKKIEEIDWRFLSKQYRGATGIWHFNYVQKFDNEIWLTSRNLNSFIVVNLDTKTASIRTMNHKTVILLHDGLRHNDEYFFTSIDGKIIIATDASTAKFETREHIAEIQNFSRDMICEIIRLEETDLKRQPNWCRGISCIDDRMYVSIDGRYDSDLSFGVYGLKRDKTKIFENRLKWEQIGDVNNLKYVTGFDLQVL